MIEFKGKIVGVISESFTDKDSGKTIPYYKIQARIGTEILTMKATSEAYDLYKDQIDEDVMLQCRIDQKSVLKVIG